MTVDILVAFDRNAAAYANRNGGVADFALTAVAKMNTVLANNALDEHFRFRLVGTMEVAAEATDVHAALEAIRDSEAGWAAIKEKRDEVGGDIVTTLIDTGSAYGTTGASWPLTTGNYATFADFAYNVCAIRAVEIGHAMTREVGHNMGAGNATSVADADRRGPQLYDYSSGYYFTGSDGTRYHTIMADSADGYGNTYALAPLFSSFTASWNGVHAGDATHDNARTLLSTCAYASNWRAQKVAMSYDVFVSPEPETLFDESISVTLTPGKNGLDIRYTTDGSEPTLSSPIYSKPLKLTRTTTVKAAAVYDGRLGPIYTAHYLKRDLATALNAPQLVWTTSPDDPWVAQSDDAFDGFAAKSCPEFVGNFGCGKTSWLKTTVTGPTEMGFRYQKTQYSSAFKVYCDDQVVWSDSETEAGIGGAVWHQAVVNLPEETHEITFAFEQGDGSYNGFNGIVLDTVCFDAWSASPTIEPETTDDQATATVFTGSKTVTLTPPAGRTGTLFYTLDGSDPTQEGALPYTGPFTVDKSVFVQAVFVEPGRDASAPARGYFLERHPMKPGEWTTDVEGVKEASARDGRLIAVLMAHRADCDWTKAFMPVAESPEFLTWAEMNGVYLITADDSERVDTEAAKNYFRDLYSGQDAIFPTLVFADPSNPDVPLASGVARNDGVATIGGVPYDDTVESLVRGFAAVMGETFVPAAPTASPESELVAGFPVTVTLTNPNASGTIYYTLDGSAPTLEKGTRYAGPIKIVDKKAVLCAAVRLDSGLSGLVLIKSYKTGSDVVWTTLPTGMAGYGYVVSNLTATAEIRPDNEGGYALPIGAKVGIYAVAEEGYAIVGTNPYVIDEVTSDTAIDASALPTAQPSCVVTVGDHAHLAVAWTGGDGSVTNEVDGASFEVAPGTENVKVIFTADDGWEIVGDAVVELGTVTEDIGFGEGNEYRVPTVCMLQVDPEHPIVPLELSKIFQRNMVIQRDRLVRVWGKGPMGETVTVSFAGQTATSAVIGEDDLWEVAFARPFAANPTGQRLKVSCSDGTTITLDDVLVGDVWIAAGESNMVMPVNGSDYGDTYDADATVADMANHPQIRWMAMDIKYGQAPTPEPYEVKGGAWGKAAKDLSAVAYHFAHDCVTAHPDIPVGIIGCYCNALSISYWTPGGTKTLWNCQLAPITRFAVRGAIWYQGETDACPTEIRDHRWYGRDLLKPMVAAWRKEFGVAAEDFPFYFVQLAGCLNNSTADDPSGDNDDGYRAVRESMFWARRNIENCGMVVAWDCGRLKLEGETDLVCQHPRCKNVLGKRLARLALRNVYGDNIVAESPYWTETETDGIGNIRVKFDMNGSAGLTTALKNWDDAAWPVKTTGEALKGFAVAGSDKVWHWANAVIESAGTIRLSSPDVAKPLYVRNCYRCNPVGGIANGYNEEMLPIAPIATEYSWYADVRKDSESDDPPVVTIGDHPHLTVAWTGGDGSVTNAVDGTSFEVSNGTENVKVIFTADSGYEIVGDAVVDLGTVTENIVFGGESGFLVPRVQYAPVPYVDADGVARTKTADEFDVITEETRFLANGWYAVVDDADIAANTNIVVEGNVHLILCDGASLTVTNAPMHCAAVSVGTNATLAIYGQTQGTGRLTAKGGTYGAGIGGGHTGDGCGAVVIHGGTITATGGTSSAGIGGCYKNDGGSVTITGGRIAATKKGISAVDIGNGSSAVSDCEVSISGGVFANPVETTWCAEGYAPAANPDPATAADYPYTVRPAYRVTIGEHPNVAAVWTCGDRSVTNEIDGVSFGVMPPGTNGVQVIFTAESGWVLVGDPVVDVGEVAGDIAFGDGFRVPGVQREPVKYIDADGEERSRTGAEFDVVTTGTRFLTNGWYVVLDDVVIREKTSLSVLGDAHLILCDGASLTVTNVPNSAAAIAVGAGASLAVYGQTDGTGRLEARGGMYGAGIGGGSSATVGSVAIHGGTVQAYGGSSAASIGSGLYGDGGSVTITGGRISATYGSTSVSVIGNGASVVSPCAVSISGGVFARSVQDAWCADHFGVFANTDPATAAAYPYAVLPACMVTIGKCPIHVTAAWTGGDGSATNAIEGGSVVMPDGTPNVRVVFTVDDGYALDGDAVVDLGTVTGDIVFGDGNDYRVPHAVPVGAIDYLEWDAVNGTLTNATVAAGEWTLVTDETRTLGDGWYVVAYDVALPVGSNIVVNGSAHLILCDGARLSVTGGYDQAAIEVSRTDAVTNSLAIYGQAECTGRLTAQGGDRAAVIGTGFYGDFGAVTINGGTVTLTGGWSCPAIGNGWWGQGGAVTINAGRVTAVGDMRRGNCAVSIRGGIFGMSVPDAWCADHHGVFRNLDPATCTEFPYAVLPAWKVTIGDRRYMTVGWTSDDELMTNAVEGTSFKVRHGERNVRVIFTVDSEYVLAGDPVVYVGTVNSDIVFGIGNDFKAPHAGVPYLDWDEANRLMTNAVSPAVWDEYSTSIRDLQDGHWYVVKGEHTIRECSGLRVSGDVHLILCDGSSLSIVLLKDPDGDGIEEPGIEVGEGASLTVYGQATGSGRLVVVGGNDGAAGIGGRMGGPCGAVTINGGEVSSAGGSDYIRGASGIGTGDGGYGGSVTINGGKVTASGNEYGAGIGADYQGRNMTVIINGGTVTATGGADGVGIGGPYQSGKGSTVTISGGAIKANSMDGSIEISGGIFSTKPNDNWLVMARSTVPNMDETTAETYPWRVVASNAVVSPGSPLGPYETAAEATNVMAAAVFLPSEEVLCVLSTGAARGRYAGLFGLDVVSKAADEWYVEAMLTDAAKTNLAETATAATRQIPVAEIAALPENATTNVVVTGCEPGFYYTLHDGAVLTDVVPGMANCDELCGGYGEVEFPAVGKPSDAMGFFRVGVSATK